MSDDPPAWHQALAYIVTGRRHPELGRQRQPDLPALVEFLRSRPADEPPSARPGPLPPDLADGIGPAQLAAAVVELRRRLGAGSPPQVAVPLDRPLTEDERRLVREVPPHHG